jgi:metallo-beta-lactamase family protein
MEIYSWGAAGEVTGSKHFLETAGALVQVDCGIFQGRRQESYTRNRDLPYDAAAVHACVLTHGHLDHCGNLPTLLRAGFQGPIYCTPATQEIARLVLLDSAHIQKSDAEYVRKVSREKRLEPYISEPLYNEEDVENVLARFHPIRYGERKEIAFGVSLTFTDAGHILGSAMALLEVQGTGAPTRVVFSGDIGRKGLPILRDPVLPPDPDVFVCESTYGDRLHDPIEQARAELGEIVRRTSERGGKVVIPAFAIGRTQEIIYFLHLLSDDKAIPEIPIFVDSPMAVKATAIFGTHTECYDQETREAFLVHRENPFGFERLTLIRDVEESKRLNGLNGPAIIVSSSGMAEGGRILHHLANTIEDPRNTILIVGFMAANTLGRRILEGNETVRIFGEVFRLRARVEVLDEFSAHADYREIRSLLDEGGARPRDLLLVHGEEGAQQNLARVLGDAGHKNVTTVRYGERYRV